MQTLGGEVQTSRSGALLRSQAPLRRAMAGDEGRVDQVRQPRRRRRKMKSSSKPCPRWSLREVRARRGAAGQNEFAAAAGGTHEAGARRPTATCQRSKALMLAPLLRVAVHLSLSGSGPDEEGVKADEGREDGEGEEEEGVGKETAAVTQRTREQVITKWGRMCQWAGQVRRGRKDVPREGKRRLWGGNMIRIRCRHRLRSVHAFPSRM